MAEQAEHSRMRIIKVGIPQKAYDMLERLCQIEIQVGDDGERVIVTYDKVTALARECLMRGLKQVIEEKFGTLIED